MALTEEQKERIRKNRERALEIQRRRKLEQQGSKSGSPLSGKQEELTSQSAVGISHRSEDGGGKRTKLSSEVYTSPNREPNARNNSLSAPTKSPFVTKSNAKTESDDDEEDQEPLEDFEVGAPPTVTKKEAMKMYCLPEGTLQICSFEEKPNPHGLGFSSMKLYSRKEIRRRAHERFDGLAGLVEERRRREEARFKKALEETKDVFKRTSR